MNKFWKLIRGLLVLICFLAISFEAVSVRAYYRSKKAGNLLNHVNQSATRNPQDILPISHTATTYLAELSDDLFATPQTHVFRSKTHRLLALQGTNFQERYQHFCMGLSALGDAIAQHPKRGMYLARWASLRQLLGSVRCSLPYTEGDYLTALDQAISLEPYNSYISMLAARVLARDKDYKKAYPQLKNALQFKTKLTKSDRKFVIGELTKVDNIQKIIPASYQQVSDWSTFLMKRYPEIFNLQSSNLSKLQIVAIDQSFKETDQGRLALKYQINRLLNLLDVSASDVVRRKIDRLLVKHYSLVRGKEEIASYFKNRTKLHELYANIGETAYDSRPLRANLSNWNSQSFRYLDNNYQSIGIYIPAKQRLPKYFELNSKKSKGDLLTKKLSFYVSDDNYHWTEITNFVKAKQYKLSDRQLIVFTLPDKNVPFWKVSYNSSEEPRNFGAIQNNMVKIYG